MNKLLHNGEAEYPGVAFTHQDRMCFFFLELLDAKLQEPFSQFYQLTRWAGSPNETWSPARAAELKAKKPPPTVSLHLAAVWTENMEVEGWRVSS